MKIPKGMTEADADRRRLVDLIAWRGARDERKLAETDGVRLTRIAVG